MAPRTLTLAILTALLAFGSGSPVSAKDKPKSAKQTTPVAVKVKRPKTWEKLVIYVLENGADRSIKAPASRTLGYDEDTVPTRTFRYKRGSAPDGKEHVIHAIYKIDEGKKVLTNVTITNTEVTQQDGQKHIDGYAFRLQPDGTPISAFRAYGIVGDVVQSPLNLESAETKKVLDTEKQMLVGTLSNKDFDE